MGNLSARVGAEAGNRNDELAELSRDFDHMAEQIESLILLQGRVVVVIFVGWAAPVARVTVALGRTRLHANAEATSGLDRIELEAGRLNTLIGSLLQLARLESGSEQLEGEPVMLDQVVAE